MTESFVLVTQYYPPERGAAQVRLASVVAQLVELGHRVDVVTALPNYPTGRIFPGWRHLPVRRTVEAGVPVTRVWIWAAMGSGVARMVNYASFGVFSLLGLARTPTPTWYIVEYPTLFGALPAVLWAKARRRRVVVIVADLWVDAIVEVGALSDGRALDVLRRVERWMFRHCDAVTAVTEGVRDRLLDKGVDEDRLVWLPNGVDIAMFSPGPGDAELRAELGLAPEEHLFVYAGTHGYVHGLDVVLDAAAELRDAPVRFLLVGGGSEKPALVERAASLELLNVTFLDPVDPAEVGRFLRIATAGLATVRGGDLYRTIRSAKMFPTMATGIPVIYSGDDEGSRVVARSGAGLVTPPEDGSALAGAVRQIMADPARAAELGRAGREHVVAEASWGRLVGDWLDEVLVEGPPTVGGAGR